MTLPTHFFIDTNILDKAQYNFDTQAISTFVPEAARKNLKFVLPDPIEREYRGHIKKSSEQALIALKQARNKNDFLKTWSGFPADIKGGEASKWNAEDEYLRKLENFLDKFDVIRLAYEGIKISSIMDWYDSGLPPFGVGGKEKEFPDAFAIEILDNFANNNTASVAVISDDDDMRKACERYPKLMYFSSLPKLTEILIADNLNLDNIREYITVFPSMLKERLKNDFAEFFFYHKIDELIIVGSGFVSVILTDTDIVAVGESEFTFHFEAEMNVIHQIASDKSVIPLRHVDTLEEVALVTGIANLNFSNASAPPKLNYFLLDSTDFRVDEVEFLI